MLFKALDRIFSHKEIILNLLKRATHHNRKLNPRLFTLEAKILHLLPHFSHLNVCAHQFVLQPLVFCSHLLDLFVKELKIFILCLNFLPALIHLFLTLVIHNLEVEDFLLHIVDDLEILDRLLLGLMKLLINVLVNLSLVYLRYHALVHRCSLGILHLRVILEV